MVRALVSYPDDARSIPRKGSAYSQILFDRFDGRISIAVSRRRILEQRRSFGGRKGFNFLEFLFQLAAAVGGFLNRVAGFVEFLFHAVQQIAEFSKIRF